MDFETKESFGLTLREDFRALGAAAELAVHGDTSAAESVSASILKANAPQLIEGIQAVESISERRRLLQLIGDVVSPAAILVLAKATATAYDRPLSSVLSALLEKLSNEAQTLPPSIRVAADHSFRDLFKHIVQTWSASSIDSVSRGYESMFGQQEAVPIFSGTVAPEPERILYLAFETGATGSVVWTAIKDVSDKNDGVREILEMLKRAPSGSNAAATVAQQFATPQRLSQLLYEDPVDFEVIDALVSRMGARAAQALVDAVAEAKTRETRRGLLDRLVSIGPEICNLVSERLKKDQRWYVQRNMLMLLREAKCSTADVAVEMFLNHADARVRREAIQLRFTDPVHRDRALASAFRDSDVGILKLALKSARMGLPESVVPILAKRVVDPTFPPEFRTSALQLLARSSSVLALEPLLRYVLGGTTLLGKPKLASKTPEMLIALGGLARSWSNERRAAPLLAIALDSKDPEIANAVRRPERVQASDDDRE